MPKNRTGKLRWRRLRMQVFHEAGWRCEKCRKPGALECDHVIPLAKGGKEWERSNLQALCRSCHFEKTAREKSTVETIAWRSYLEGLAVLTGKG